MDEQDQQVPPPQFSPHPGHPAFRGNPQNCQSTEDGEGLLAGGEEGGDDLIEVQHGGPRAGEVMENGQNAEPARGAQEETPTPEDPQAPGHQPPKEL